MGATSKNPMLLPCLNHILLPYFGSICEAGRHGGILWVPKCQSGLTWALNFSETNCHFPRRFASRDTPGRDYQKPNAFTPLNHKFLTYFGTYFDIRALRTHVYLSSLTCHRSPSTRPIVPRGTQVSAATVHSGGTAKEKRNLFLSCCFSHTVTVTATATATAIATVTGYRLPATLEPAIGTKGTQGTLQLSVAFVAYVVDQHRFRFRGLVFVSLQALSTYDTSCPVLDVGSLYAVVELWSCLPDITHPPHAI
jgi:hypothetical protein